VTSLRAKLGCVSIVWIVFTLLFEAASVQPTANLSTAGPGFGKFEFERPDGDYHSDSAAALPFEDSSHTLISFTKFDRKQNTRLWPFVFTGITRSPPF
jgi:hypothetical protein